MRSFLLGQKTDVQDVPTARDYVQDGLIAMWDGIENAGWGTHDATATVWKDLITGFSKTDLQNYVWTDKSFCSSNSGYVKCSAGMPQYPPGALEVFTEFNKGDSCTFEICRKESPYVSGYDLRPRHFYILFEGYYFYYQPNSTLLNGSALFSFDNYTTLPQVGTVSVLSTSAGGKLVCNGMQTATNTIAFAKSPVPNREFVLNESSHEIYSIRIYNRALTSQEISANYAIDARRFGL